MKAERDPLRVIWETYPVGCAVVYRINEQEYRGIVETLPRQLCGRFWIVRLRDMDDRYANRFGSRCAPAAPLRFVRRAATAHQAV